MKSTLQLIIVLTYAFASYGQKYKYPGQLEIRTYRIGDIVDTTQFKKIGNLYFPNYLDGWSIENYDELPKQYKKLPIALWQYKNDSSIVLTLLNNKILNITVSFIKEDEKEKLLLMAETKFGAKGKVKSYEETHYMQSWITYWNLITWDTKDVIFQIGNSDMRKPKGAIPTDIRWNLVYSDFIMEKKIINEFKKN